MSTPTPGHKLARYRYVVNTVCECGWASANHSGPGARKQALVEWHSHKDRCAPK